MRRAAPWLACALALWLAALGRDGFDAWIEATELPPLVPDTSVEVLDRDFAGMIESRIDAALASARPVTIEGLRARPFPLRLLDRILWLGSPYL